MKFRKLTAVAAAAAMASVMAVSVSAADWSLASYADDNPGTVKIISTDENGATFTQAESGSSDCKLRITLINILENPEDVSKVYSGSWDVTYNGLSNLNDENVGWLGGGAWCATCNSTQYSLSPTSWTEEEEGRAQWEDSQTVQDSFKWLLPSQVPSDAANAEFVFMDWSGQDLVAHNITVTVSNFHLYDKDGNEIPQKAYGAGASDAAAETEAAAEETAAEETEAPAEETAAAEETEAPAEEAAPAAEETEAPAEEAAPAAEEAPAEEAAPAAAEEEAPASDDTTEAAATGNTSTGTMLGIMAVAAAAGFAAKKRHNN